MVAKIYELQVVRRGTLADIVRHVMTLPQERRHGYAIEKARDHRLRYPEIFRL